MALYFVTPCKLRLQEVRLQKGTAFSLVCPTVCKGTPHVIGPVQTCLFGNPGSDPPRPVQTCSLRDSHLGPTLPTLPDLLASSWTAFDWKAFLYGNVFGNRMKRVTFYVVVYYLILQWYAYYLKGKLFTRIHSHIKSNVTTQKDDTVVDVQKCSTITGNFSEIEGILTILAYSCEWILIVHSHVI